ncbi:MAG: MmcQ/YjbR family DNA-binding protein [Nocardioidaceae bacterium]
MGDVDAAVARARRTCLHLPDVEERPSHSAPTFFVRGKKSFASIWVDGHHDNEFPHLWVAAPSGAQEELVGSEPRHFFVPPYVGGRGWLGVRLDRGIDLDELAELCEDAYRTVAPKTLVQEVDERG